jgi:hypothetical protein
LLLEVQVQFGVAECASDKNNAVATNSIMLSKSLFEENNIHPTLI